jgi:hypothetical protein
VNIDTHSSSTNFDGEDYVVQLDELIAREEIKDVIDDHNSFRGNGRDLAKWVCEVLPHFKATHHFIADPRTSPVVAAAPRRKGA